MTECHTYQKGGPFEKQDLVGLNDLSKVAQVGLELLHIWDQLIDNAGPCLHTIANQPQRHNGCGHLRPNSFILADIGYLIKCLIPNGGSEAGT